MTHTVNDLLTAYEHDYLPAKAPTTQYQQRRLYAWLRQQMGERALTDLTPAYLRAWRDTLSARYAPGTVLRYLHSLSGPLTAAVLDYEWLAENPLRKIRKPPGSPARVRFLSDDERTRLLAACRVSRNPHLYAAVLLALSIGARKSQVLGLRWRDIDLARGLVRVPASKRHAPRSLPLLGPVVAVLARMSVGQSQEAWVFARHDGLRPILVDAAFASACQRAGISGFRFHDLRHTCASYLAMSGSSLPEIAEVLGHRSIVVTTRYVHLTAGHTRGVLARMADQFLASLLLAATGTTLASVWLVGWT